MITERYRTDYDGEFVITAATWTRGRKRLTKEWVDRSVTNTHVSNRAACIGSATDLGDFDFSILQNHKGGLLATQRLQLYGTADIAKIMRLDFVVDKRKEKLQELIDLGLDQRYITYANPRNCLRFPGRFHNIPYYPVMLSPCLLPYLAAFDGHTEIFMLGFHDDADFGNPDWSLQLRRLFEAYSSTRFIQVGHPGHIPECWKNLDNVSRLSFREFIFYADV